MKSRFSFSSKKTKELGDSMIEHYIDRLVELTNEKFFRMPRGLSREERRMYIKFVASVESGL